MHTARRTFVATLLAGLLAALGVTAAVATGATPDGPPKIAFLANGRVPADALAAGPIAGQLGAPLYTTEKGTLVDSTANALAAYDPELVIVLGGTAAISDVVVDQVATATGLTVTSDASPTGGIVRAAGGDRFATATAVADLLAAYDPAYLPVGSTAVDAGTLDGKDSSAFLSANGKAVDAAHADTADSAAVAETLDGKDSTAFAAADAVPISVIRQPDNAGSISAATAQEVVSTSFTAPSDGVLNIDAFVYMLQRGTDDIAVNARILIDGGVQDVASTRLTGITGAVPNRNLTFPLAVEVTGGQTYTIALALEPFNGSDIDLYYANQRLAATFLPASQVTFDDSDS